MDFKKFALSKEKMASLRGGLNAFVCTCHGVNGNGGTISFVREFENTTQIIDAVNQECGDYGGHCEVVD